MPIIECWIADFCLSNAMAVEKQHKKLGTCTLGPEKRAARAVVFRAKLGEFWFEDSEGVQRRFYGEWKLC